MKNTLLETWLHTSISRKWSVTTCGSRSSSCWPSAGPVPKCMSTNSICSMCLFASVLFQCHACAWAIVLVMRSPQFVDHRKSIADRVRLLPAAFVAPRESLSTCTCETNPRTREVSAHVNIHVESNIQRESISEKFCPQELYAMCACVYVSACVCIQHVASHYFPMDSAQ